MSKLDDTLLDDFLERRDKMMRVRDNETRREDRMLKFHTEEEVLKSKKYERRTCSENFSNVSS